MDSEQIAIRFVFQGKDSILINYKSFVQIFCLFEKNIVSSKINFRQMMFLDSPMVKLTWKDGIVSLMHCQE